MNDSRTTIEKDITIKDGMKIILKPEEKSKVICEVCGTINDTDRALCRVCSNYLEKFQLKSKEENN